MSAAARADAFVALARTKVVPVVRTSSAELAAAAVDALAAAGFTVFEITLTIPGALDVIRALAGRDGVQVGVGTVTDAAMARQSIAAGARFLVSPCVLPEVVGPAHDAGLPVLLGAMTPTEVLAAARAGADGVKVFPASSAGGAAHVKALRSIFPAIPLVPTGGIAQDQVRAYLDAGAAFVGMGGRLVDEGLLAGGRAEEMTALGRQLRASLGLDAG